MVSPIECWALLTFSLSEHFLGNQKRFLKIGNATTRQVLVSAGYAGLMMTSPKFSINWRQSSTKQYKVYHILPRNKLSLHIYLSSFDKPQIMKLSLAFLSSVLFATTIVAIPSRTVAQRNQERNQRRAGNLDTATSSGASATINSPNWVVQFFQHLHQTRLSPQLALHLWFRT